MSARAVESTAWSDWMHRVLGELPPRALAGRALTLLTLCDRERDPDLCALAIRLLKRREP